MTTPPVVPDALAPLAFLLGTWRGEGVAGYPTIETVGYGQQVDFRPYGKPALEYSSRTWALEDGRPMARESGYWRLAPDGTVEVLLAHPTGIVEVYLGTVWATTIDITTDVVARTLSAKDVSSLKRRYGLVGEELMYAMDMEAVGQPMQPHVSARLRRVTEA